MTQSKKSTDIYFLTSLVNSFGLKRKMNIKYYSKKDFPSYLPKLNSLYDDLFQGGKGLRSQLIQKVALPLGHDQETVKLLCQSIEFIHNASLLHDDLVDRSPLRRGKTSAWLKYSPEYSVLAGDYLLARVMTNLSSFGNIGLVQLTSQTISELLEGEWIQDSLVGDFQLSFEQLTQVHNLKTASLFRWCLWAPFIALNHFNKDMKDLILGLGTSLGLLFQRSDDLLDYNVRNNENKAILGDLRSGYLNSFGAFLCRDMDSGTRLQFKNVQSLEEIYRIVGGEDFFQKSLSHFDRINQEEIDLYRHKLKALSTYLQGNQKRVVDDLKDVSELLYWRQKQETREKH